MTPQHISHVAGVCARIIQAEGVTPKGAPSRLRGTETPPLPHALWMCGQAQCLAEKDAERAQRWLGFVQGVMWREGLTTIDELWEMNRKVPPTNDESPPAVRPGGVVP